MTASTVALAVGSGGLVGFTLGLIGGGGSIMATPLLLYVVGVANPHVAIGTGALAVAANAWTSLLAHARKGHVQWRCAIVFALVGVIGALGGSTLGLAIDGKRLLFLFGLVMAVVGLLMLRGRSEGGVEMRPADRRTCLLTAAAAAGAGFASGFFGIGGGFLIVPALILTTGMPTLHAIGSSLLAVGAFGVATALNYARADLVDWVIAAEFIAGGAVGGLVGMLAATRLAASRNLLSRIFAVLVLGVSAFILAENWPGAA